jgi:hypothetical protein
MESDHRDDLDSWAMSIELTLVSQFQDELRNTQSAFDAHSSQGKFSPHLRILKILTDHLQVASPTVSPLTILRRLNGTTPSSATLTETTEESREGSRLMASRESVLHKMLFACHA